MEKSFSQFDLVRIITTRNINYVSAQSGMTASPDGLWSVVGVIGGGVLVAKDGTLAKVPPADLVLVAKYALPFSDSI